MSNTRKDISKLIEEIQRNNSIIDSISSSTFKSVVAEIIAQNKKLINIQREAFKGVDYIARFRNEFSQVCSIAVEVKQMKLVGSDAIKRFQESISSLKLDRSYFVTNSSFTEAAKRLAEQQKNTLKLNRPFFITGYDGAIRNQS